MQEDKPSYFAILPANVRYDSNLNANAKLLYAEITSLTKIGGSCFATNEYFAELYGVSVSTIKRMLKQLCQSGYITTGHKKINIDENLITRRSIIVKDMSGSNLSLDGFKNEPYNIINNISKEEEKDKPKEKPKKQTKKFIIPTLDEVTEFCKQRNNNVDPKAFFDYYDVNNWEDSKGNKVRNWKQKMMAVWEKKFTSNPISANKSAPVKTNYISSKESDEQYEKEKQYWDEYLKKVGKL